MRYEHMDDVSLHTYIHTYMHAYIGTANLPYVTLVFGACSGSLPIMGMLLKKASQNVNSIGPT